MTETRATTAESTCDLIRCDCYVWPPENVDKREPIQCPGVLYDSGECPAEEHHLVWTSVFMQYGADKTEEHDSLRAALSYLFWGEDQGTLSSDGVRGPDGEWAVKADTEEWKRHEDEWLSMWSVKRP